MIEFNSISRVTSLVTGESRGTQDLLKANVFSLLMCAWWFKLLLYLSVIKKVSIFQEIFIQSLLDIQVFTFVLILVVFSYTEYFYFKSILSEEDTYDSYLSALFIQYRSLIMGDFPEELNNYTLLECVIFTVFTFFTMVVLLNLLIAIVSDTHERITTNFDKSYGSSMAMLLGVLEISYR